MITIRNKFFCHDSAFIDEGAVIGYKTKIWHNCHITGIAKIGKKCSIGQNCFVAGVIGKGCKLQNNVSVFEGVKIGDWVFCGPSMTFTNVMNPRAKYPVGGKYVKTLVLEGASLGANSTIICGVTVGRWVFVGAGSVVTKDIPDYALVYGNPAVIKGWVCECGQKLESEFSKTECKLCGRKYLKKGFMVKQKNE